MSFREIILVQDRKDNYHLVDWIAPSGRKYTLCDVVYQKKTIINTFSLDNVIDIVCPRCQLTYKELYSDEAMGPRQSHSSLIGLTVRKYTDVQRAYNSGDKSGITESNTKSDPKNWTKLDRYKRKLKVELRK